MSEKKQLNWEQILRRGVANGRYVLKLAETDEERKAAFKLRFDVFNVELDEGLPENEAFEMDTDVFDSYCDHLLVLFEGEVVGTYRVLLGEKRPPQGFYTEGEFHLDPLFKHLNMDPNDVCEMGRGCIHPEHRKQSVLMTLFWGLYHYILQNKKIYLLGCGSLPPNISDDDADATYELLKEQGVVKNIDGVHPVPEFSYVGDASKGEPHIPPLVKIYKQLGAHVMSTPAYDKVFKCHDLLIVFKMSELTKWGHDVINRFDRRMLKSMKN